MTRRTFAAKAAAMALALATGVAAAVPAAAETAWPTRTVTFVVPFAAGGPTDTVARLVAQAMSADLGQQIVVENVGGAAGTLGAARVARAEPDGYTLLLHHIGQATAPAFYRKLTYKPQEDFAPIGLITPVPMTLVARGDLEANDLAQLVKAVKAAPDKFSYGDAGLASASNLCGLLFMKAIGQQLVTASYKGTGPAMNDLLGGQIDLMCDQTTNTTAQIRAGKIKVFGVTTPKRLASMPDVPTLAEAGLPGVEMSVWHALYAPKGTDQAIVERLAASLRKALQDQVVVQRFADLGTVPEPSDRIGPEVLKQFLASETVRWTEVIQAAGVFAE